MATLSGKWLWNPTMSSTSLLDTDYIRTNVQFVSNGTTYHTMMAATETGSGGVAIAYSDNTVYTASDGWVNPNYRTVDFGSGGVSMDDNFYSFFTANATKIPETYTVTYYVYTQLEGSSGYSDPEKVTTQSYKAGDAITPPESTVISGYGNIEWANVPAKMPSENLEIYGYRNLNLYTLTFKSNGETIKTEKVPCTFPITYPDAPALTGHTFIGWSSNPITMPKDDLTISAVFEKAEFTITYYVRNQIEGSDEYSNSEKVTTQTYRYGETITAPSVAPISGYGDIEWENLPATMPAEALSIYGYRHLNLYTLTFKADGETVKTGKTPWSFPIEYPSAPVKTGYTFTGWDSNLTTMPKYDLTINAVFEQTKYTVNFVVDGVVVASRTGVSGSSITYPADPVKPGFTFIRWDSNIKTMPIGGATINAVFEANVDAEIYTVTYKFRIEYNNNGVLARSEYRDYETQQYEVGATIVPAYIPEIDGYFCHMTWRNLPNTMPANDVTTTIDLDLSSYTVKFMVDGSAVGLYTGRYTMPITYPADPTKEGYIFTGWTPNPETMPLNGGNINATFQAAEEPDVPDSEHLFIKMATLEGIAGAVREKAGTSGKIPVSEIRDRILALATACEAINALYMAGKITSDDVSQSVADGLITAEDYKKITGDDYAS